jgi:hypothetical protein
MRKKPTYNKILSCSMCGALFDQTGPRQKYCPSCKIIVTKDIKIKSYIKLNPNAYKPSTSPTTCSVCDSPFSCWFDGIGYCNKHYLRMYNNGSLEPLKRKTNDYIIKGDIVEMYTNKGEPFIFDLDCLERVKAYSWCTAHGSYLVANINYKVTRLHRYILGLSCPETIVDHINGNPKDNRTINLRLCTLKQNSRNAKISINNSIGYVGIRTTKEGKYKARIMVDRKEINLGVYDTFELAKDARIKGEIKYFGDFAPSKRATAK